jgi:hypothetical protein
MYLPSHTYHIVQRGNNREACFVEPENYQYYLDLRTEGASPLFSPGSRDQAQDGARLSHLMDEPSLDL